MSSTDEPDLIKSLITQSRGRKWITCVLGGHKAMLAIDEVTADLPMDSIVTIAAEDLSTRSGYGVQLKFRALRIVRVRDAAQARAA